MFVSKIYFESLTRVMANLTLETDARGVGKATYFEA